MKKYLLLFLIIIFTLTGCSFNTTNDTKTPVINSENPYFGSDNDVYRINITTKNNAYPNSLTNYISGMLNITEQDISIVLKDEVKMDIKLRGNSTSGADKKPFKIKFNQAESLFGLEAAKDWVLLANYFDKTNIRNYLAYITANKLDSLGFQPSSIFVDVYLNGKYEGLYMLTEQMEANKGRVDIENNISSSGISSFLIEADVRALDEYQGYEGKCYTHLDNYVMRFRYPNSNDYVEALESNNLTYINEYEKNINWATNYLNEANTALKTNNYDNFSNYFDINSFIDYYLIQELFKNVDVGNSSQLYVIDQYDTQPKIKCGPVWDFDISAGVIDNSQSDIYTFYTETELFVREADHFYRLMFKNNEFIEKVKERYKEIKPILFEIFDEIEIIKNALSKAQLRNLERWPFPKVRTTWIEIYGMNTNYFYFPSLYRHYTYLTRYLEQRFKLLDTHYQ